MHMLEIALFVQLDTFLRQRCQPGEPAPQQWPRPRRSRTATAALAAVTIGIAVMVVGVAVVG